MTNNDLLLLEAAFMAVGDTLSASTSSFLRGALNLDAAARLVARLVASYAP
jgi:hypothetical protein